MARDLTLIADAREMLGRKFENSDIQDFPNVARLALDWLQEDWQASGSDIDSYLSSVRGGLLRYGALTPNQLRGVMNCCAAAALQARKPVAALPTAATQPNTLQPSIYTVVLDGQSEHDTDDYVTIRIKSDFRKGPQYANSLMAQYLYGPQNDTNYKGFAFVTGQHIHYWSKSPVTQRIKTALEFLVADEEQQHKGREMYAKESGKCARCGRTLTVPLSLHRGLGPECANILGVA